MLKYKFLCVVAGECEGWGDPHYITFDGVFYSYQGNCTYVLMEEITPKHNLKVAVDNVYCDPTEDVSCPRSIIVTYRSQVITLKNHNLIGAAKLEVKTHMYPWMSQNLSCIRRLFKVLPNYAFLTFVFNIL